MTITALPTPPSRDDPTNFRARADAFLAALPTFTTEANATAADVLANAASASSAAAVAQVAASVTKWISGTSYAQGVCVWSPIDFQTYRCKVAGSWTTDPSADSTNWALLPAERAWVVKTGAYTAFGGDRLMCNTTAGGFNITLPASPSAGMAVTVSDYANKFALNNLTVLRGSANIDGLAENWVCDVAGETRTFVYIDVTQGWRVY